MAMQCVFMFISMVFGHIKFVETESLSKNVVFINFWPYESMTHNCAWCMVHTVQCIPIYNASKKRIQKRKANNQFEYIMAKMVFTLNMSASVIFEGNDEVFFFFWLVFAGVFFASVIGCDEQRGKEA